MSSERDGGRAGVSLLCRNLPLDMMPEDVRDKFAKYGDVRDVYLPRDYYTGRPRGFGFIEFVDPRDADDAVCGLDGKMINGREVSVVHSKQSRKTPKDMRRRDESIGRVDSRERDSRDHRDSGRRRSRSRSPRRRHSRSPPPRRLRSPPPRRRDSRSPPPRRSRSPAPRRRPSRSPPRRRSRSPVPRRRSPSPLRQRSLSPAPRRSRSLRRSHSRSPVPAGSVSPVLRRSRSLTPRDSQ